MEAVVVRFLKPYQVYNPQEVAGFDAAVAEQLVKGRIAELVRAGESTAAAPSNPTPDTIHGRVSDLRVDRKNRR